MTEVYINIVGPHDHGVNSRIDLQCGLTRPVTQRTEPGPEQCDVS